MVFFLCLVLKIVGAWFLVIAAAGLFRRLSLYPEAKPRTRFACLIPARNEEAVIGRTVKALLSQDYPRDMFEVFVIPNNCTDRTEAAARAAGARIIPIKGPVTRKGDVLNEVLGPAGIRRLSSGAGDAKAEAGTLPRSDAVCSEALSGFDAVCGEALPGFDAVCVFDADNIVAPDYLSRMNDAFCAGARVAKGRLRTLNPYATCVSGCYALYFGIFDWFFNRPRAALGLSAKLVGTGFAVSLDYLASLDGWNTRTIAEDAEFSAFCAESGERVYWVPEAVSYDEAPLSFRDSLRQRRRWCSGIMDVSRIKAAALFRTAARFASGRQQGPGPDVSGRQQGPGRLKALRALDGAMFLCSPYFQAASPLPLILTVVTIAFGNEAPGAAASASSAWMAHIGMPFPGAFAIILWYAAATWLGMTAFGALLALLSGCRDQKIIKSILFFPIFMASWIPLQMLALVRRTEKWEVIRHGMSCVETVPAVLSASPSVRLGGHPLLATAKKSKKC